MEKRKERKRGRQGSGRKTQNSKRVTLIDDFYTNLMLQKEQMRFSNLNYFCSKQNLPKDVFIIPDRSKPEQMQVCRQFADIFYGILPAQQAWDRNKELIQKKKLKMEFN